MAIKLEINLTNNWLYTLIGFVLILSLGIGVLAYTTNGSGDPSVMGHSADEVEGGIKWVKILEEANASLTIPPGTQKIIVIATAQMWKQLPGDYGRTVVAIYSIDGVEFLRAEIGGGNNNGGQARSWASTTGTFDVSERDSIQFEVQTNILNYDGSILNAEEPDNYNFKNYIIYGI